jgi:DNA processing protein
MLGALSRDLSEQNIHVLTINQCQYPASLRSIENSPPVIYVKGNLAILGSPGIGICGSRRASKKGLSYARQFGGIVASLGVPEVSGYARGVDTQAHIGALEAEGNTIVVLAEGMKRFRLKKPFQTVRPTLKNMLVISQFHLTRPWHVSLAMERNRTICGLSKGLVVVEAQAVGGTFHAGQECLRQKKPLMVIEYSNSADMPAGNKFLIEHGGHSVGSINQLRQQLHGLREQSVAQPIMPDGVQISLQANVVGLSDA